MTDFSEIQADAPEPSDPTGKDISAVQIAWRALTAPSTGAGLAFSLALIWSAVLVVPQGVADAELLARFSYAEAQMIRSLGLQNIVSSWPSLALIVLLLLHVSGLLLWAREREPGARTPETGGWSTCVTYELEGSHDALSGALTGGEHGSFYGGSSLNSGGTGSRFWRGFWREGLILIALGVVFALASVPVDLLMGMDARMTLATQPGERSATPISTMVRDFRGWVQGESPVQLSCQDPDPADALRRRSCEARSVEGVFPVTLRAGATSKIAGVSLTPSSERPRRQSRQTSLLLEAPGEGPRVLRGEPGRTYELAGGGRLTTFEGPDGPLVVARASATARPVLLGPGGQGETLYLGHAISGVSGWLFDVDVESKPGRPLRLAGGLLLIIGLLLMALVPHLEIVLVGSSTGARAVIRSHNRADLPHTIGSAITSKWGAS